MIKREEVMPLLLKACPSIIDSKTWKQYISDPAYIEDNIYIHLGVYAIHIVNLHERGVTSEFLNIFEIIEELHLEGDSYVKEAATIGLLEKIQNVSQNQDVDTNEFIQYLYPESLKWWNKLNDFWNGNINALRE